MKFRAVTTPERKLQINWPAIEAYAARWRPGTRLEVNITRKESKVSDPMRKWYFGAVLPEFMQHLGYEPNEDEIFHRQLKITFFRVKCDKHGIYRNKDIPSVFGNESQLPISEKRRFLEWVLRTAAKEGCYIEDPIPRQGCKGAN